MFLAELPFGANWFDVVWAVALVYGVISGIRTGLLGEIGRLVSWGLITWLSLTFYVRSGDWIKSFAGVDPEPARLTAYLLLVICVYMISLILRRIIYKLTKKTVGPVFLQNVGGALAGAARMTMVMIFVTVWLSLTRSPFWHRQVSHESKFGSQVMGYLPEVAAVTKKPFKEEFIFFRDIERLGGTNTDDVEFTDSRTNKPAKPH